MEKLSLFHEPTLARCMHMQASACSLTRGFPIQKFTSFSKYKGSANETFALRAKAGCSRCKMLKQVWHLILPSEKEEDEVNRRTSESRIKLACILPSEKEEDEVNRGMRTEQIAEMINRQHLLLLKACCSRCSI